MHFFTDGKNLSYMFASLANGPDSPKSLLFKVYRWAINLSRFEFFIKHIEGSNYISADILIRWFKSYRSKTAKSSVMAALYKYITPATEEIVSILV